MNWHHVRTVARTDIKQLTGARDFWFPMLILGSLFFLIIPAILLLTLTQLGNNAGVDQLSQAISILPESAQEQIKGETETARIGYALAVFLFAPIAIVVPLTISTAVGSSSIVGERERGTGEFLAHSPAGAREIYMGKLIASFVPGYATTLIGFGAYSILVNLVVGPEVGGWFFPTSQWWGLMLWVMPPFLLLGLSMVLRLSAKVKSTAAAHQAAGLINLPLIGVAYGQSAGGMFDGSVSSLWVGLGAWAVASLSLYTGMRAVNRGRLLGVAIS